MKRLYLIALFALVCGGASAQENGNRDAQNRVVRGPYETNRLSDNIFVGVAGGINLYFGEHDSQGKFGKRLAPALDIHVGKWFTSSIGARVGYTGLQAKGWTTAGTMYAKKQDGDWFQEKFGVSYLHADALWNFSNAVSGYKEERTWNFMPFAGVGWARSYGNDTHDNEIGFDVGLLNVVRLCKALDLTLEARCLLVNQRFDGVSAAASERECFRSPQVWRTNSTAADSHASRNRRRWISRLTSTGSGVSKRTTTTSHRKTRRSATRTRSCATCRPRS